jgi:hypothetical protein
MALSLRVTFSSFGIESPSGLGVKMMSYEKDVIFENYDIDT